jgi:hypothetical protein
VSTTGPMVETVSRKRIVTQAELEKEQKGRTTPDFWEFIETMTDEMWAGDFMLYIYREDPKPSNYGGSNCLEKCPGFMIMPNGVRLKLDSREDTELAIKEKWGGKAFRLILKKGRERLTEGKCMNDAPPKYPDTAATMYQQNPLPNAAVPGSSSDVVATRAMDLVANNNPQIMTVAMDAISRAADLVARHQPAPAAASPLDSELDRAFKQAMIQKMLAEPPDPFEMFVKFKQIMGDSGGGMGGGNPLMDKVLSAAVDKILNPVAQVTGRTTLLDVGREVLPALINGGKEIMHEYRLSVEAQAHIAETQRGMQPQSAPAVPAVPQQNPPAAIAALPAAVPQPTPQQTAGTPSMTFPQIAAYIANVVKNVEHTTDEAVEDVLAFLYNTSPDGKLVRLLLDPPKLDTNLKPGKDGLIQLFQFEPSLNACLTNLPRVSEFLDKFIVAATEAEAAEARLRAAAPASTKPS